jgi:hypothetical protein
MSNEIRVLSTLPLFKKRKKQHDRLTNILLNRASKQLDSISYMQVSTFLLVVREKQTRMYEYKERYALRWTIVKTCRNVSTVFLMPPISSRLKLPLMMLTRIRSSFGWYGASGL